MYYVGLNLRNMLTAKKIVKRIKLVTFILGGVFLFSSCGVIAFLQEKFPQHLAFKVISSVPDSEVYINGIYVGQTPYSHYGRRVNVKTIKVKKDGYKTQRQRAREFSPTAFLDYYTSPLLNPLMEFAELPTEQHCRSICWVYKADVFYFKLKKK